MKRKISYNHHFIFGESFQRKKHGSWVAQYTLIRRELSGTENDPTSHQHQFNAIFRTENEADEYAVRKAKERIDENWN